MRCRPGGMNSPPPSPFDHPIPAGDRQGPRPSSIRCDPAGTGGFPRAQDLPPQRDDFNEHPAVHPGQLGHARPQVVVHLETVGLCALIAGVLGVLLGIVAARSDRFATVILAVTSTILTVPSFALFGLLSIWFGFGNPPVVIGLVLYALLPIVRNTRVGIAAVDPAVTEAARGMGMSQLQVLTRIQLPLAIPVILGGLRQATVMIVAIATVGAAVGRQQPGRADLLGARPRHHHHRAGARRGHPGGADRDPRRRRPGRGAARPRQRAGHRGGDMITFDRVTKRYGDADAVHELTLEIPSGETVIFVGPSGCGKTTSLKMINRLIEPTSGVISIDGNDTATADVNELRRSIGYVIQQIGLFPALHGGGERGHRAAAGGMGQEAHRRPRGGAARPRRPARGGLRQAAARGAERWRTAARRRGPCAGGGPQHPAHGRALRGHRPDRARTSAERAAASPAGGAQDDRLRDPRHRRGDPPGRPGRAVLQGRPPRAVRDARGDAGSPGVRLRRRLPRRGPHGAAPVADQRWRHPAGALNGAPRPA